MTHAPNPDQVLLHGFVRAPVTARVVDTNPVARDLQAVLLGWSEIDGVLRTGFTTEARHLQGHGDVHGGVVSTMLDFGLAFVGLARLPAGRSAATVSLTVQFERAVQPGPLTVQSQVDRLGGRLVFASAVLLHPQGPALARATATLAVLG